MMAFGAWLSRNRRIVLALAAILGVYFALGNVYALVVPALEKPDEQWHYAYVSYLLTHGNLPPITTDETLDPARQEAGQPPSYYLLAASSVRALGSYGDQLPLRSNPTNRRRCGQRPILWRKHKPPVSPSAASRISMRLMFRRIASPQVRP